MYLLEKMYMNIVSIPIKTRIAKTVFHAPIRTNLTFTVCLISRGCLNRIVPPG